MRPKVNVLVRVPLSSLASQSGGEDIGSVVNAVKTAAAVAVNETSAGASLTAEAIESAVLDAVPGLEYVRVAFNASLSQAVPDRYLGVPNDVIAPDGSGWEILAENEVNCEARILQA